MDYLFLFFAVAIFIAVILLIEGVYVTWNSSRGPEAKRITRRLQIMSGAGDDRRPDISIRKKRVLSETPGLQRVLQGMPRAHALDRLLDQSGLKLNVARFLLASLACGCGVLSVLLFFPIAVIVAALLGIAAMGIPLLFVIRTRHKRLIRIEEQLPDALDLMSRALRAGHALPSALQMIGDEMADPIAGEFRIVFDEVNFGVSMQDALSNLARRVPDSDVGYFVVAVLIQRETGGNLTELLGNIATIVRDRLKLFGHIRTLSAEGRLSAWILGLLPFVMVALLNIVNPKFMQVLWTDPAGIKVVGGMLVMMAIGVVWMRAVIRIRV